MHTSQKKKKRPNAYFRKDVGVWIIENVLGAFDLLHQRLEKREVALRVVGARHFEKLIQAPEKKEERWMNMHSNWKQIKQEFVPLPSTVSVSSSSSFLRLVLFFLSFSGCCVPEHARHDFVARVEAGVVRQQMNQRSKRVLGQNLGQPRTGNRVAQHTPLFQIFRNRLAQLIIIIIKEWGGGGGEKEEERKKGERRGKKK